ncbi:MAG: tetratricopeptide repeat protein [bacterium]|nr:tetratricopeptide repeat protein [bacterium]
MNSAGYMKLNLKIKLTGIVVPALLLVLIGCGGVKQVTTDLHIPEMDTGQYSDSHYKAGWRKLKEGKPREAMVHFEQSVSADDKLHVGYGYVFLSQGKLQQARRNFLKSLELNPDGLQAQFGLATIHEKTNEPEEAFLIYSRLRTKHPDHPWIKIRYEFIKSTQTEYFLKQAQLYKDQGETPAYIEAIKKATRYSPELVNLKVQLADLYNQQQQYEPAAQNYEMVLEKQPNNEEVLKKLAAVYEYLNKIDAAVMIHKKMLEFKPGDPEITKKISDLKMKFYQLNLPGKFKGIFFQKQINREELAALIGYYFDKYLEPRPPVIVTDIGGSFAKEYIIKICTLGIMKLRPDHSFGRFPNMNRAGFAVVLDSLINYLEKSEAGAYTIRFTPLDQPVEPADISPLHRNYKVIKFLVNSGIMKPDAVNNFNPTLEISPDEVLNAVRKILNSIRER